MVAPGSDQELVIDRAAGAAAPDSSVVATRQGGIG
jgi:hypothetical protein